MPLILHVRLPNLGETKQLLDRLRSRRLPWQSLYDAET